MIIYDNKPLRIFFGEQTESFKPQQFYALHDTEELLLQDPLKTLKNNGINYLITLKQIHSSSGFSITSSTIEQFKPYAYEGDFLITNVSALALGVATADCLAIILHDKKKQVIGIVHAGWQGSVQNIVIKALEAMQRDFYTNIADVSIFFSPAAGVCCYEVKENFLAHIPNWAFDKIIQQRTEKFYCNLSLFNQLQLESLGISNEAFDTTYNLCTICNRQFCSYRRDGVLANRQLTTIVLQ